MYLGEHGYLKNVCVHFNKKKPVCITVQYNFFCLLHSMYISKSIFKAYFHHDSEVSHEGQVPNLFYLYFQVAAMLYYRSN